MSTKIPPPTDNLSFEPIRSLLNPKFETYQLQIPTNPSTSFLLPKSIKLRTLPDHARLSFAEVQARVHHNHLAFGKGGEAIYFDQDFGLIAIELKNHVPLFHPLLSLPIPISNNLVEYPVCISIDLTRWVVSDGNGLLYIIIIDKTSQKWQGKVQNTFELIEVESTGLPFRLHSVTLLESGDIIALISTTRKEPSSFNNKSSTIFDYRSVIFSTSSSSTTIQPLDLQWKL